jgi:anthranilate synthase component 1
VQGKAWIVAEPGQSGMFDLIKADLRDLEEPDPDRVRSIVAGSVIEEPPERFLAAVQKAQTHIARGDIYQANLSRVWRTQLQPDVRAGDLYARLRETNPAPFAGLAVRDDFAVISSSPERLLRLRGGRIETRPIAGTRPRDEHSKASDFNKGEFLAHPKERAEHIMLIDLERNDLGRICSPGSVSVDEFMTVETYAHVHHIVSTVTGRPRDRLTPGQMISAVFPGGSI